MPKQLNLDLSVRADTSAAKKNLEDLRTSLTKISSIGLSETKITTPLSSAIKSAKDLETHLNAAFNVKTGNIDLSKFEQSLAKSGQSAATLATNLLKAGTTGEQAFVQLQRSIGSANIQLNKSNGLLNSFLTTLKNTAKWQISSSVLHGFMGAIQTAYGYAQDLNKSLTDIRIVTGQSSDQMAAFAERANKAAKALSTTTNEYAKSALIFYQQGLNDEQVTARNDVTTKMAQATGDSAQEVSSYMTAIWNNFAKGSKDLEHFADVITALGATTASSSAEISEGLGKFAAIADTVGLSYEYATSALATVVAQTRQSADVVGTAFKTLFARMQDLELGDEGSVSLGKYAQALDKVGISILDSKGNMLDMNSILDQMGSKWDTLSKAQQTALAQNVAGTRQYTQLVALMDNWDEFQKNLGTATTSDGSLQKQADIYAESWEGAQKRVRASMEAIYSDLLDDEFFIKLSNGVADFLGGVDKVIDGLGGVKTIVFALSTVITKYFAANLTSAINAGISKLGTFKNQITGVSGGLSGAIGSLKLFAQASVGIKPNFSEIATQSAQIREGMESGATASQKLAHELNEVAMKEQIVTAGFKSQQKDISEINNLTNVYQQNIKLLTEEEQKQVAAQLEQLQVLSDKKASIENEKETLQEELSILQEMAASRELYESSAVSNIDDNGQGSILLQQSDNLIASMSQISAKTGETVNGLQAADTLLQDMGIKSGVIEADGLKIVGDATELEEVLGTVVGSYSSLVRDSELLKGDFKDLNLSSEDLRKSIQSQVAGSKVYSSTFKAIIAKMPAGVKSWSDIEKYIRKSTSDAGKLASVLGASEKTLNSAAVNGRKQADNLRDANSAAQQYSSTLKTVTTNLANGLKSITSVGGNITSMIQSFSSVAMAISTVSNAINTLKDDSASLPDKLVAIGMAGTMGLSAFMSVIGQVQKGLTALTGLVQLHTEAQATWAGVQAIVTAQENKGNITLLSKLALMKLQKGKNDEQITSELAKVAVLKLGCTETEAQVMAEQLLVAAKGANQKASLEENAATVANIATKKIEETTNYEVAASEMAALWPIGLIIAAIAALIAIIYVLVKAFKSDAEQLQDLKDRANHLGEALNEAKQEAEDLKSAFDNYDEIVDRLKDCTKGTKEWQEALTEANSTVLELLENYPELASMVNDKGESAITRDSETGIYQIAEWAQDELQSRANHKVDALQMGYNMAQADVREKETSMHRTEVSSDLRDAYYDAGAYVSRRYDSNADGTIDENDQTVVAVGEAARLLSENIDKLDFSNLGDSIYDLLSSNGYNITQEDAQAWADSIINSEDDLIAEMNDLGSEINANTAATNMASQIAAESIIADDERIQNSSYADDVNQMSGEVYQNLYEEAYQQRLEQAQSRGWFNTGNDESKQAWKDYAELMGIDESSITNYAGNGSDARFIYNDGDKDIEVRADEAAAILAAADAAEQLSGSCESLITTFANLDSSADIADHALQDFIVGKDFENASRADFEELRSQIGEDATTEDVSAYLADHLNVDELTDDIAKQYGFETAQQMCQDFIDGVNNYDSAIEAVGENLSNAYGQKALEAYNSVDTSQMNVAQMEAISNDIGQAFVNGGREAAQWVAEMYNHLGDQADEFADATRGIDWANISATELRNTLRESGIVTDLTNDQLEEYINLQKDVANVTSETANQIYKSIHDIIDDLTTGDTISAEDYEALGAGYEDYFMMMADGTYKLIGNAQEFYDLVNGQTVDNLRDRIMELWQTNSSLSQYSADTFAESGLGNAATRGNGQMQYDTWDTAHQHGYEGREVDYEAAQAQIDYLKNIAGYEESAVAVWQDAINAGDMTIAQAGELAAAVNEEAGSYDLLNTQLQANSAELREAQEAYASTATSFSELQDMLDEGIIGVEAFTKAYNAMVEAERMEDLDADEIEDYTDYLMDLADSEEEVTIGSQVLSDELADNKTAARNMAIQIQRMNKGVDDLADNWDDWSSILKNSSKGSEEYFEASQNVKDAMSDLLDISSDYIDLDFVDSLANDAESMALMEKAAQGDGDAIDALRQKALESIVLNFELNDSDLSNEDLWSRVQELQQLLDEMGPIEAGVQLDMSDFEAGEENFIEKLNQMILEAGMSADQVNAMLAGMGFQANFASEPQAVQVREPDKTITHHTIENRNVETMEGGAQVETFDETTWTETIPGEVHEGEVDAYAMETSEPGVTVTPKIESVTRMANGSANNYSSSNRGGKPPGRNSGGNRGGDRRRSNKDLVESDPKEMKEETDRYHVIRNQLEDIEESLNKISTAKDKAFGAQKLKFMDQEIAKQRQLIKGQRQYLAEIQNNLNLDQSKIASYGAKFDANGTITNYEDIQKKQNAKYNAAYQEYIDAQNAAVVKWNNSKGEDADQTAYDEAIKAAEKEWEAAQQAYEDYEEALSQYEETQDLFASESTKLLEELYDEYDKVLAKTEEGINLRINFDDRVLNYLDYLLETLEDDAWKTADAIGLVGQQASKTLDKATTYRNGIASIIDAHSDAMIKDGGSGLGISGNEFVENLMNGNLTPEMLSATNVTFDPNDISTYTLQNIGLTQDEIDSLSDKVDELIDANKQLEEYRANVFERMTDAFDSMNEEMDTYSDKIKHVQKITENYGNIVDIVGKKALGINSDMIRQMGQSSVVAAQNLVTTSKNKMDSIAADLENARQKRAEAQAAGLEDDIKYWDQFIKHAEEEYESAQEDFMQNWEDALQQAADVFADTIDSVIDDLGDAVAGTMGSISALRESFDLAKEIEEDYLDDYEKVYLLTKLNRDIAKDIDDTNNIKAKRELLELQDEINQALEEGGEMSQYDLDNLQKKYDLKKAEIALEEARNTKSQVSMTRDSEGNYGYVYTADANAVANAEQNYDDKLYEMQKANEQYIDDLQEKIIALQESATSKLKEAADAYGTDSEEYARALAEIQDWYDTQMIFYTGELDKALENSNMTFDQLLLSELTGYQTLDDMVNTCTGSMGDAVNTMTDVESSYAENNARTMELAGSSMETYAQDYMDHADNVVESTNKMAEESSTMKETVINNFEDILGEVQSFETEYSAKITKMIQENTNLANSFNTLIAAWSGLDEAAKNNGGGTGGGSGNSNGSNGSNTGSGTDGGANGGAGDGTGNGGSSTSWERVVSAYKRINAGAWGNGFENRVAAGAKEGFTREEVRKAQDFINYYYPKSLNGKGYSWDAAKKAIGFDTGGYTGEWGSDGRLAMLHQKELVLNEDDTRNLLEAVDMIRTISQAIDLNAIAASAGLATGLQSSMLTGLNSGTLEQQVTITAEFPNATDKNEILEAFDNVINLASQYANRKL